MDKLANYISWLQEQNLSPKTVEIYQLIVGRYYGKQDLTQENITEFIKKLVKNHEPDTIQLYKSAIFSYARFCKAKIDEKRISKIVPQRVKKFFTTITLEELELIKKARFEKSEWLYQRNNLIFDFLIYSGLRISELVQAKHKDWQGKSLRVLGKGNKVRQALLIPDLVEHIQPQKSGYLFSHRSGQMVSTYQVREILRKRVKLAGIKKRVSPHTFRRSFATLLNGRGCRLTTIQKLLGHSTINMTAQYIHNDYDTLYEDYSKILKIGENISKEITN